MPKPVITKPQSDAMTTYTTTEAFQQSYNTLHATFSTGRTKDLRWRKWQLKQLWWMLDENEQALSDALKTDLNRHPYEALTTDIYGVKGEITSSLNGVETWARGETPDAGIVMGRLGGAHLRKEPLGVALIIGAWNYPLYTLLAPVAPAIAAGNCILLKPSELAGVTAKLLVELIPKYMDESAIRIATGGPQETGLMLEHKFNHIFYTGGSKVGRIIATAAARHLTPTVLELGGQAPAVVTKTANVDLAAKRIANAKITNAGQICLNVNHVFVHPDIHDELVEKMKGYLVSWFKDGTSDLAHIISEGHYKRITNLLGQSAGKQVYTGVHDEATKFVHPTIISDVTASDALLSEELFAPVIPVIKADVPAAIETINSMPHPLAIYIFSTSQAEIDSVLDQTASGGVTVNDIMLHAGVPNAPFGGVGESGYGAYHGKWGFDAFSHTRTVVGLPNWMDSVMAWRYPPFKIENSKKLEPARPKFRKGETLEDQTVTAGWFRWFG